MSANIYGNRFFGYRTPAWHKLGKVMDKELTLTEAFIEAELNYPVHAIPASVMIDGQLVTFDDTILIVRPPQKQVSLDDLFTDTSVFKKNSEYDYVCYGQVSDKYSVLQNMELAEVFNSLSEKFHVETCGALGKGEKVFATLNMGSIDINGEEVKQLFYLVDTKDGTTKTKIGFTPVRIVCENTLVTGLRAATINLDIRHDKNNKVVLKNANNLVLEIQNRAETLSHLFGNMAQTKFSLQEFKELASTIYKIPEVEEGEDVTKEFEKLRQSAFENQNAVVSLFQKFSDEFSKSAETKWAAYNSIVEWEDFKPGKETGSAVSALFGARAKVKEYAFAELNR